MEAWFGVKRWCPWSQPKLTKFALLKLCESETIVVSHEIVNIIRRKYLSLIPDIFCCWNIKFFSRVLNIKTVSIKYCIVNSTAIIDNQLITTPNACNYFDSAGHSKLSRGLYPARGPYVGQLWSRAIHIYFWIQATLRQRWTITVYYDRVLFKTVLGKSSSRMNVWYELYRVLKKSETTKLFIYHNKFCTNVIVLLYIQ